MNNQSIKIGNRTIGRGHPVFIVAEIGINHNGDMALAKAQIDAAAEAGVDSVKFQNYHVDDFVSDRSLTFTYKSQGKEVTESQYDMFLRCQIGRRELEILKEHCDKRGIIMHSTPTSAQGIQDLVDLGVPIMKNGSDYLSQVELVSAMGLTGLPTVLSTGMATLQDIDESVAYFRKTGNDKLILLQCTSNYPTAPRDVHLAKIQSLATKFGCLVGLSDHSEGAVAAVGAAFFGACWIEKHFTSDKNLPGPDQWYSADPAEMAQLVRDVRAAEQMMGSPEIGLDKAEEHSNQNYRLSCAAAGNFEKGHVLGKDDINYQRPGTGWRPSYAPQLVGKVLKRDVDCAHIFTAEDFE